MNKAVVFDADGTLLNSFELIVAAYHHVATSHGLQPPTAEEVREQLSMSKALPEIYRTFFPEHDPAKLVAANGDFIVQNSGRFELFEGVHDLLGELVQRKMKLAILTSGNHKIVHTLEAHGLDRYFTSVVHCERVRSFKPDPEGFLLAAREMRVEPGQTIMIGDTPTDVQTGKNGGAALTIALTHGYAPRADLLKANADYVVDSLAECLDIVTAQTPYAFTK